jgi:ketosteroid isomerase-like protein
LTESLASGISIEMNDTEVYAHGDVGYMAGTYTVADAGGAIIDKGKYVDIWRQVDGKWQISRAIWNSNLPLATPEPEPEPESEDEAEVADEV